MRDRAIAAALHDWWRGRRSVALAGLVQLVASDPTDADVAEWASHLAYTEGDERALAFVSGALADARPTLPLVLGLRAVAMAEAGHDGEAVLCARRALAMDPQQPHAQAVIADDHARRCDVAGALDMLDMELLPAAQTDAHALQRAIALVWRMEMQGVDVGNRWREIGDMVQARWHEHILPLLDLHFIFALARDGREQAVRAFFASMERVGEADNSGHWQSLVIPLARGLVLLAQGSDALAASVVEPVLPRLHQLGACRAGREAIRLAFKQATPDAHMRPAKVSARRPAEMQVAP